MFDLQGCHGLMDGLAHDSCIPVSNSLKGGQREPPDCRPRHLAACLVSDKQSAGASQGKGTSARSREWPLTLGVKPCIPSESCSSERELLKRMGPRPPHHPPRPQPPRPVVWLPSPHDPHCVRPQGRSRRAVRPAPLPRLSPARPGAHAQTRSPSPRASSASSRRSQSHLPSAGPGRHHACGPPWRSLPRAPPPPRPGLKVRGRGWPGAEWSQRPGRCAGLPRERQSGKTGPVPAPRPRCSAARPLTRSCGGCASEACSLLMGHIQPNPGCCYHGHGHSCMLWGRRMIRGRRREWGGHLRKLEARVLAPPSAALSLLAMDSPAWHISIPSLVGTTPLPAATLAARLACTRQAPATHQTGTNHALFHASRTYSYTLTCISCPCSLTRVHSRRMHRKSLSPATPLQVPWDALAVWGSLPSLTATRTLSPLRLPLPSQLPHRLARQRRPRMRPQPALPTSPRIQTPRNSHCSPSQPTPPHPTLRSTPRRPRHSHTIAPPHQLGPSGGRPHSHSTHAVQRRPCRSRPSVLPSTPHGYHRRCP